MANFCGSDSCKTAILWPPCAFLLMLLPFRIYYLSKCYTAPIPFNAINVTKTTIAAVIAILSLIDMTGAIQHNSVAVPVVDIVSPLVQCSTMVAAMVLINKERERGVKSSAMLSVFWLMFLVSKTITVYSTFMATRETEYISVAGRFVTSVLTLLLVLGEFTLVLFVDNRPNAKPSSCPEEDATFFSKITYCWFYGMISKGNTKSLTKEDVYNAKTEDSSANVIAQFDKYWNEEKERLQRLHSNNTTADDKTTNVKNKIDKDEKDKGKKDLNDRRENKTKLTKQHLTPNLFWTLVRAFWPWLLTSAMFSLSMCGLNFTTPLTIKLMMKFIEKRGFLWQGYMYAVIMFVAKCIRSLVDKSNNTNSDRLSLRARTSIMSVLYRKIMTLSNSARQRATSGEVINIMSVDTDRFVHLTSYWTHFWSAPIQIILALVFLWQTLGYSVLCGTLVMAVVIPFHGWLAKYTRANEVEQRNLKDSRIKLMNEILNGVKVLKLYAWEKSFEQQVLEIRNKEIEMMKKSSYLNCMMSFIWHLAPFLLSFVTFAVYLLSDPKNALDAEKIFVALSLLEILRNAMGHLPRLMTELIPVSVALKRLQTFLGKDDLDHDAISKHCSSGNAISIENGVFKWKNEGEPDLKNINVEIPKGSLVAIVGVVASGKSSLLSAILGEMDKVSGHVGRNGSVAYVAQQAWIQNTTLRKNILFGSPYEKTKYENVVEACSLHPDLELLAGGDLTEIGEKGINLSGGQKQRVSLARALYQNADIYLLDDPLSAVDAHVGKHIFDNIIGSKGLLKDKTRLLVTHGTKFLSKADKIIVLEDGQISEAGTYRELMTHYGAFADFLKTYAAKDGETCLEDSGISSESSSEDESNSKKVHCQNNQKGQAQTPDRREEHKLIEKETVATGEVSWSVYGIYLKSVGPIISLYIVAIIIWNASHMYSNVLLSGWGSEGTNGTAGMAAQKWRLGLYGAAGIAHGMISIALEIVKKAGLIAASRKLHSSLLANVIRSPMHFFDRTPLGRIVNRFSKDIDLLDRRIPNTFADCAIVTWEIVTTIGLIAYGQPLFLVVIIPMAACYIAIQKHFISTARQLRRIMASVRSPTYSHFGETLSGVTTIRAFGQQEIFALHAQNIVETLNTVTMNLVYCYKWLGIRMDLLSNSFLAFASIVIIVISRETMSSGVAGLILAYSLDITNHLMRLAEIACELETNIISVERINEYSETPREAQWEKQETCPGPQWPEGGAVKFNDYGMRYSDGQDLVLKDISCEIKAGEKVGIVGRTGAGKSSLTMALFRLIEGAKGSIEIDGVDISTLGLHDLRSQLTIIPQDPVLFSGSLRMNLDPFNAYTEEQIWQALKDAHFDSFVSGLEDGLMHECAEGGENISVGQRQLVCLARALLRKTKILILDEATAAVDLEMDDLIQKTIRNEFSDCTVMTIAHRLNTIMDYTRVMVLEAGRIVEFDSPQALLKDNTSRFYGMARDAGLVT